MKIRENIPLVVIMIVIAALTRLIPHYPNFTAVGAMALFGGAYLSRRLALAIPLLALFLSDLILNNAIYSQYYDASFVVFTQLSLWTYGGFILIVLIGMHFVKRGKIWSVVGSALGASLVFFLLTNFGVWVGSAAMPKTIAGLILCYELGIPFFWNTVSGNLFFSAILFGGYEFMSSWLRSKKPIHH